VTYAAASQGLYKVALCRPLTFHRVQFRLTVYKSSDQQVGGFLSGRIVSLPSQPLHKVLIIHRPVSRHLTHPYLFILGSFKDVFDC